MPVNPRPHEGRSSIGGIGALCSSLLIIDYLAARRSLLLSPLSNHVTISPSFSLSSALPPAFHPLSAYLLPLPPLQGPTPALPPSWRPCHVAARPSRLRASPRCPSVRRHLGCSRSTARPTAGATHGVWGIVNGGRGSEGERKGRGARGSGGCSFAHSFTHSLHGPCWCRSRCVGESEWRERE